MMQFPSLSEQAVEQILELSADIQIKRRAASNGSTSFREMSAAIAAYGEMLELLTTLRSQGEAAASVSLLTTLVSSREPRAII
jgi:hypothetical protein